MFCSSLSRQQMIFSADPIDLLSLGQILDVLAREYAQLQSGERIYDHRDHNGPCNRDKPPADGYIQKQMRQIRKDSHDQSRRQRPEKRPVHLLPVAAGASDPVKLRMMPFLV